MERVRIDEPARQGRARRAVVPRREPQQHPIEKLQRTVGNAAVVASGDRRAMAAAHALEPVQRQMPPLKTKEPARGAKPEPGSLDTKARLRLEMETGDRMGIAFTKFSEAASDKQRALREAAKEQAELLGMFVDIAFMAVAPGLGKLITKALDAVPVSAPEIVYKGALMAVDKADKIAEGATSKVKDKTKKGLETALLGGADTFLENLKQTFSEGLESLRGGLKDLPDPELFVLCSTYSATIATKRYYVEQIDALVGRFRAQVEAIGNVPSPELYEGGPSTWRGARLFRIQIAGGARLALVSTEETWPLERRLTFRAWISPDMEAFAVAKHKKRFGEIETLDRSRVKNVP